jgi:hypothetical protein
MSDARRHVLWEAEKSAVLRGSGYPDAEVLPQYCIGNEIGEDRIFTRTISIHVGDYQPKPKSTLMRWLTRSK